MLGISPTTLRRMALFYEAAFIPLPSGKGGHIYPDEVLKQFQAAKQLVDERRAGSLENAFLILAKTGVDADEVLAVHTSPHEVLGALRQELRLGELRRRDEQPQARRPWWKVWGE